MAEVDEPLLRGNPTDASITRTISDITLERPTTRWWWIGFAGVFAVTLLFIYAMLYLFVQGVGIWGVNIPVAWGFAIVNYVWWIGIGNAGTLISAMLYLMHQEWRGSINRFAEAMTLFAAAIAGLFPIFHLGRPSLFYWLVPYPNTMTLWPQWRSPLVWDIFAISIYLIVSFLFWYTGLLPDLATLRDRARTRTARLAYGVFALGWRGSARHWSRYQVAYLLLAGLATPLVVSVHSVVGFDFAVGLLPGWHDTLFAPYFVIGAMFSGFAMVLTLTIPLRRLFHLYDFITERHLDNMAKILLATGLIVAYSYVMEIFMAWYSGDLYARYMVLNRMFGPYAVLWWALVAGNVAAPQLLWSRAVRLNPIALFAVAIAVNVGMWIERFVITVVSLHRGFLPSRWGMYSPTGWDWALFFGAFGLFVTLFFVLTRFVPLVPMFELRKIARTEKK